MKKLRPSGDYRDTCGFQTSTIIYDATVWFCEIFVDSQSRTVDQMVQAARSGRQNIAEGRRAAATSLQTEMRLINVARASFEELLLDYEDFLRHRRLPQWTADSPEASAVRRVPQEFRRDRSDSADLSDLSDQQRWALYSRWLDHENLDIRANALICLIHQANFLLDRQIAALERALVEGGGYSEQLATARLAHRRQKDPSDPSDQKKIPPCPQCDAFMTLRTAKTGKNAGSSFWCCTKYPDCKGIISLWADLPDLSDLHSTHSCSTPTPNAASTPPATFSSARFPIPSPRSSRSPSP